MIEIVNAEKIGYSPQLGEKLHETIEKLRSGYYNTYGDFAEKTAVIVIAGVEFYVMWAQFSSPMMTGLYDSQEMIETLDFFVERL